MRNRSWLNLFVLLLICSNTVLAQRPTSLRGQVTDQLGAVVVGVSVTLTDANGKKTATQTDSSGAYRFDNLTGGVYTLTAQQKGFASETIAGLELSSGANTHDIHLGIVIDEQRVTVDDMRAVSTDPNNNKTARIGYYNNDARQRYERNFLKLFPEFRVATQKEYTAAKRKARERK